MKGPGLLFVGLIASGVWTATLPAGATGAYGLPNRSPIGPFLNSSLPPAFSAGSGNYSVVSAFPNLTFEDPTFLISEPGTNRLLVCGRQGTIWIFNNDPAIASKTVFLSLTNRCQGYDDCGLLGMAFHPEFGRANSTNRGFVYVYYQYNPTPTNPGSNRVVWTIPTYNRLSRFTVPDGSLAADPGSELVLVNQFDQHLWHNGGALLFGLDGFLYWTDGDEGGLDDFYGNAQKINRGLFSGVLRIDVNQDPAKGHPIIRQPLSGTNPPAGWLPSFTANYYIPNDNPFVNPDGSVLEEFYAIGFRSPHRMTLDPPTGQIWLGDVGDSSREEVDIIVKGGNYQWAFGEGYNFPGPNLKPSPLIGIDSPPIWDYPHANANSCVIGGYVYRGTQFASDLGGLYIFGDDYSGRIWTLTNSTGTYPATVNYLCNMPPGAGYSGGLSSFGLDQSNELYMCTMGVGNGAIWKLGKITGPQAAPPPTVLSQVGVFTNLATLATAPGLIPYNVNCPLWSDGALKTRWLAVPSTNNPYTSNAQISFASTGEWSFPIGTVFVKHFELQTNDNDPTATKRLETRVLVAATNGAYYGLTYKWRPDYSDADLLTNSLNENISILTTNGGTRTQTWYYPSSQDCLICHNPNANYVLGAKTRQLNGNFTYPSTGVTDNQLRTLNSIGLFNPPLNEPDIPGYASLVSVTNAAAPLETRTRSYIDANCSLCHRPNSGIQSVFDARFDTPLTNQGIINGTVIANLGIAGAQVVVPGNLSRSIMHVRMDTIGTYQMPPLGMNTIDSNAVAVIDAWILGLPPSGGSSNPPVIIGEPQNVTVNQGANAQFTVTVIGTPPYTYLWQLNGSNLAGGTNSTLFLTNVEFSDAGNYSVLVYNSWGGTSSTASALSVLPVNIPSPTGLVDWWPGDGNANDIQGTNNGTLTNGTGFMTGEVGQAFSFNGVTNQVNVGAIYPALTNTFTMLLWASPTAALTATPQANSGVTGLTGQRYAIFPRQGTSSYGANHTGAGISIGTNGVSVFEQAANELYSPLVYSGAITGWTHIAVVYQGGQPQLYVNGVLKVTGVKSVFNVHASADMGGPYGFYSGGVDEFGVYNRALSATEIQSVYNAGSQGMCKHGQITGVSWPAGGGLQLSLKDRTGGSFRIDVSTDLINWTPLATITNSPGSAVFTDSTATNTNRRFYRQVALP